MRRCLFVLLALSALITGRADAQLALRGGGGMIFDGSQPGGHLSMVLPFSNKPAGLMLSMEYYRDSGATTIPISARGLYKLSAGATSVYVGIGSGLIYTKVPGGALASISSTKALFSTAGGINFKFSGPLGAFVEVSYDRAFISGATNNVSGKAGLSLTLID